MHHLSAFIKHSGISVLLVLALALGSCTESKNNAPPPPPTKLFFVADSNNNRVVVYAAPFTNGQSAVEFIGQTSATTATPGATSTTLNDPVNVAVDSAGNLYVGDSGNCRVLIYNPPFTTGMAATTVLGQAALNTGNCLSGAGSSTAAGLGNQTGGVALDSSGNLWVTDSIFSRILKYPAPFSDGEAASIVLGQASFTSVGNVSGCNQGSAAPTASTLCFPGAIAFDSSGNLWVGDNGNNRVLMYAKANLVTGGAATVELGQPPQAAFTLGIPNNGGVSETSLYLNFFSTGGLAFDASGNLWVTDIDNNRVLMYPQADLKTNGAAATVELGQPSGSTAFNTNSKNNPTITGASLYNPMGLAFDNSGNLFVSDSFNSRALIFAPPFTIGMSATVVLGQPNFTSSAGADTAPGLSTPGNLATAQ